MKDIIRFSALELNWRIDGDYDAGDPGQTSGPPERCWPPEAASVEDAVIYIEKGDLAIDATELAHSVTITDGPGKGEVLADYLINMALKIIEESNA